MVCLFFLSLSIQYNFTPKTAIAFEPSFPVCHINATRSNDYDLRVRFAAQKWQTS